MKSLSDHPILAPLLEDQTTTGEIILRHRLTVSLGSAASGLQMSDRESWTTRLDIAVAPIDPPHPHSLNIILIDGDHPLLEPDLLLGVLPKPDGYIIGSLSIEPNYLPTLVIAATAPTIHALAANLKTPPEKRVWFSIAGTLRADLAVQRVPVTGFTYTENG